MPVSAGAVALAVGVGVGLAVLGFVGAFAFLAWFAWATEESETARRLDSGMDRVLGRPRDQ